MRPEMKAFLAFCGTLAVWKVSFALMARPKVDLDADGQIGITELPRLWAPDFKHEHLGQPGDDNVGLLKFGAMTLMQTLVEAMVYSFGCGMTTVLLCNAVLPGRVPDSFGWILCLVGNVITTMLQCTVTTNTIHLCTGHVIHFFYYGFGFLAAASYRRLPSQKYLVVLASLWYLCLHVAMKYYVWPNYPRPWAFLNTYEHVGNKYVVLSTPDNQQPFLDKMLENRVGTFKTTYLPYPIYELISSYIWTELGYGYAIGLLAKCLARVFAPSSNVDENNDTYEKVADLESSLGLRVADAALLFAFLGANCWALFKIFVGLGIGDLFLPLEQYYPKTALLVLCNAGAFLMLIRWESKGQADGNYSKVEPAS